MRADYEYGSAVRKEDREYEIRRSHSRKPARRIAPGVLYRVTIGLMLLSFAFCASSIIKYVQLRSALTNQIKTVASKQVELNNLKSSNDARYSAAVSSIDLEMIEQVARGELGMGYAKEGQIIFYEGANNDYMRRVGE
ncbi:MAG: hypothetical protein K6G57_07740 [Lachnospiraceae bacterium]|nr:hypothetical protein [Lachnospiraceae bacterium]